MDVSEVQVAAVSATVVSAVNTAEARGLFAFIRSVLSGPGGSGSTGRVGAFVVVFFACIWISYLVIHNGALPDLGPITIWVNTLVANFYGTNKVTATISAVRGQS
jgi:hypothetical protein